MPESWATSGVDLLLKRDGSRVRAGLEAALRDAIRDGQLAPGTRLPASRPFAADLGIARNTVAEAYGQLVAEGWLVTQRGSGTRVADRVTADPAARVMKTTAADASPAGRPPYDLTPGQPDVTAFPRPLWLSAARRALAAAPAESLGYSDPRGLPVLRAAVAEYLARVRGVRTDPDRVVICAGFRQGWALLCDVLHDRGAKAVAMEVHGVQDHRRSATRRGLRIVNLAVDGDGALIEPRDAGALFLTPAHQFPLGVALAPQRRAQAIRWAQDQDRLVIEDDYDGEFRHDRQPVGAMQAHAPEHVIYTGTVSKSLVPGVRLGWLVLPAELVAAVAEAQALALGNVSAIDQLTLAQLLTSGAYDRHVRRARLGYRRRRDRLLTTLERHAPDVQVTGIAAGLHALVRLPDGLDEQTVIAAAAKRGLALDGLGSFTTAAAATELQALVIGYGTPPDHAYAGALSRLSAALAETLTSARRS